MEHESKGDSGMAKHNLELEFPVAKTLKLFLISSYTLSDIDTFRPISKILSGSFAIITSLGASLQLEIKQKRIKRDITFIFRKHKKYG